MVDATDRFRYFPLNGKCTSCGSVKTMYVGDKFIGERCCQCGTIVGGGYLSAEDPYGDIGRRTSDD